jgi:hypothetical protein
MSKEINAYFAGLLVGLKFREIMNYEGRCGRKKALTQEMVDDRLKLKQELMNLNQHTGFGLKRKLILAQK